MIVSVDAACVGGGAGVGSFFGSGSFEDFLITITSRGRSSSESAPGDPGAISDEIKFTIALFGIGLSITSGFFALEDGVGVSAGGSGIAKFVGGTTGSGTGTVSFDGVDSAAGFVAVVSAEVAICGISGSF